MIKLTSIAMHPEERDTLSLDFDVFRIVLDYLPVSDLKEVAVVSRVCHEDALREILLRGVRFAGLRGPIKLKAFCHFMLNRHPSLLPLLHKIYVNVFICPKDEFNPHDLLAVISGASHLRDLDIHWINHLFTPDCDQDLVAVIPGLRHLRRLRLSGDTVNAHKLVADIACKMRSQLDDLETSCQIMASYINTYFPSNLGEYQKHLRVLHLSYPDLVNTPWVSLPTVHTLKLLWPTHLPITLRHIVQTFPSLRQLYVSYRKCAITTSRAWCQDSLSDGARDDALAFQRLGGGWRDLDVLATNTIPEGWMLGLACPVGCVRLGIYDAAHHRQFVDVISGARPKKVNMILECTESCAHLDKKHPVFLFPTDAGPGTGAVTHAVVFLMMYPGPLVPLSGPVDQSTYGIIETVGSHIKHSRLEYLHLAMGMADVIGNGNYTNPEREFYQALLEQPSNAFLPFFQAVFQDIDIELLVSGLAATGDHLRVIVLTFTTGGQRVWTIDRGGQMISEVTDPVFAEEIIEREENSFMYY
ncbi:hypothetical protein V8D89_005408 [Ganoderma adspersum]